MVARAEALHILTNLLDDPRSIRLIRAARRMAAGLRAEWIAVNVEAPTHVHPSEEDKRLLAEHMRLAESLGAETVTLTGRRVSEEIQPNVGQKIGLGSRAFELIEVEPAEDPSPFLCSQVPVGAKYAKVFAKKGFYNAKVSEIAREASVADGTIYLYFKNKEQLLDETVNRAYDWFAEALERAVEIEPDDATGPLKQEYDAAVARAGKVFNINNSNCI